MSIIHLDDAPRHCHCHLHAVVVHRLCRRPRFLIVFCDNLCTMAIARPRHSLCQLGATWALNACITGPAGAACLHVAGYQPRHPHHFCIFGGLSPASTLASSHSPLAAVQSLSPFAMVHSVVPAWSGSQQSNKDGALAILAALLLLQRHKSDIT